VREGFEPPADSRRVDGPQYRRGDLIDLPGAVLGVHVQDRVPVFQRRLAPVGQRGAGLVGVRKAPDGLRGPFECRQRRVRVGHVPEHQPGLVVVVRQISDQFGVRSVHHGRDRRACL
jgi:hypothetical protein